MSDRQAKRGIIPKLVKQTSIPTPSLSAIYLCHVLDIAAVGTALKQVSKISYEI